LTTITNHKNKLLAININIGDLWGEIDAERRVIKNIE
jgi:hypothetical protein